VSLSPHLLLGVWHAAMQVRADRRLLAPLAVPLHVPDSSAANCENRSTRRPKCGHWYQNCDWMTAMAAVKGRTHRTGVADAVQFKTRIHAARRAKASQVADALGISLGTYIDALLEREQLDERGRPVWWQDPVPRDQEELPLSHSA
jgi:hypothetical protein